MIPFTEALRYEIEGLTPESIVIDGGAFEGNWGRLICEKYGCQVHMFEPIRDFYVKMNSSLASHPLRSKMTLHNFGLSDETCEDVFHIKGDSSGNFAEGPRALVVLLGIESLLSNPLFAGRQIACLKLNVEGSEMAILEALLNCGLQSRIDVLHVQPHLVAPDAESRWDAIKARMAATHELLWDAPWCWTGWGLRK